MPTKKLITAKGGPLDGKQYTIPNTMTTLNPAGIKGGTYKVTGDTAKWTPDKSDTAKAEA